VLRKNEHGRYIAFVALARTSLVYVIPLAILFAVRMFSCRTASIGLVLLAGSVLAIWVSSPYLRSRVEHIAVEYREYRETNRPTSTGQRLEYWSDSISWIREAPLIGHGTGSTKRLFGEASAGKAGAWGDSVGNPHNQLLYVAIEWGALGCVILLMMWYHHFRLFRVQNGWIAWVGAAVVAQSVPSSLFNSHLFDFTEVWIYVIGVGVAAGAVHRAANEPPSSGRTRP
jgi:O-antigen ligase